MQYQLMQAMGVLTKEEKARRYLKNLDRASRDYPYPNQLFVRTTSRLQRAGKYPVMYWGGAVYFLQANKALIQTRDITLIDALRIYVSCCRRKYSGLQELMTDLDKITQTKIFTINLKQFESIRGFPRYQDIDLAA
jgi:hypothetical protein